MYATTDIDEAEARLATFHDHCRRAEVRELTRLSRTVRRWQPQVLAWHTTALTNGPAEAVNLLVKKIRCSDGSTVWEAALPTVEGRTGV